MDQNAGLQPNKLIEQVQDVLQGRDGRLLRSLSKTKGKQKKKERKKNYLFMTRIKKLPKNMFRQIEREQV